MGCGVGHRRSLDPGLLWPWCRPVAIALIGPLAWKTPCAMGAALKRQKDQKKKKSQIKYRLGGKKNPLTTMKSIL